MIKEDPQVKPETPDWSHIKVTPQASALAHIAYDLRNLAEILDSSQFKTWDQPRKQTTMLVLESMKQRINDLKETT